MPDRALTTGSVSGAARSPDEGTIRDAVSSAIVDEIGEEGIGWANVATGARGTIRDVRESSDGGALCRSFAATRESYEGVFLYRGEACLNRAKQWSMHRFDRVE